MIPLVLFSLLSSGPAARAAPAPSPQTEEWTYQFSSASEFSDFESVVGSWSVATGSLVCSSKGPQDEVAWRRRLSLPSLVRVELATRGRCTLRLTSATTQVDLVCRRDDGVFQVRQGDAVLQEGYFTAPATGALTFTLRADAGKVSVQVEDDKVYEVPLREPLLGAGRLSLLSHRNQGRFQALHIRRAEAPEVEGRPTGDLREQEDRALRLEDARRLGEGGRWREAWEVLRPMLPEEGPWQPLPGALLRLVNRAALEEDRLRAEAPLAAWLRESRIQSQDGTASVQRPLEGIWSSEVPVARRVDGVLWRLQCRSPAILVELHRYDHRVRYWFGEEPRTRFVPGSSASALARARADDQLVERTEARLTVEPRRSALRVGGETTTEHVLRYQATQAGGAPRELREYHVVHRGNAHRLSIEGDPDALEACAAELRWILETLEFHPPQDRPDP